MSEHGASGAERSAGDAGSGGARPGRGQWLWDHAGRIAGLGLGALAFAAMVFLAAIGFRPALFLVVLLVVGIAIIAVGGRIRGA